MATNTKLQQAKARFGGLLQLSAYTTDDYENVASGSASTAVIIDTIIRVQTYGGDCWISRGVTPTAVDGEGMLLPEGSEITMLLFAGESIAVIGGSLNIVPLED